MAKAEQPAHTGAGPLTERRYYVDIAHPTRGATELMRRIQCHLEHYSPELLADFHKVRGQPGGLAVGDEFHIKILGPWNGSVRVSAVADDHFEFCTLDGHPEAGRIRFTLREIPGTHGNIQFEIHSWARSRDGLVAFAYDALGIGKRVQEQAWVTFCDRVALASGGEVIGAVRVETMEEEEDGERRTETHTR